jgi:MSHA biogenesis protein MshL
VNTCLSTAIRRAHGSLLALSLAGVALAAPSANAQVPEPTAAEPTFSFSADNLPLRQALALFARANRLNIVPDLEVDGMVTVEFHDLPLAEAMQALLDAHGYYFEREGRLLRVRREVSRLFRIDYIHATRAGQGSSAVQISSGNSTSGSGGGGGGGGSSEGSAMTVTQTSTIDFWASLAEQLSALVSESGSFTINSLAGTVYVRESHRRMQEIARYLDDVVASVARQVEIEIEIYEVVLGNSSQFGINWQRVSQRLDSVFTTLPGTLALPSGGGVIITQPSYGDAPPAPGIRIGHQRGATEAVLDALKQEGELRIVSKPRLRTLNNQPAVVRIGQDLPVFSRQVTQSPGSPPIVTETETIQNVTIGTVLSVTPQVSADGVVTLDVTPAISRLVRTAVSASGNTSAPVIDIRQATSIVRLRDGATAVVGGLVQENATSTRRKVPVLGDVPVVGRAFTGNYENSERTELVFLITPRVVRDDESGAPLVPPSVSASAPPVPTSASSAAALAASLP